MDSQDLLNRYPSIADLRLRAKKRIPYFAWEYLDSGTGADECLRRNRDALEAVVLTPEFMKGVFEPDLSTSLFGTEYKVPFGVSPVGLTGLMWPRAERILARTAAKYRLPYALSTVATEAPETIGPLADGMGWFQLYPPRRAEIRRDLLLRARDNGFTTMLVTADVPIGSRRERQVRAGVRVPPKMTPLMIYRCLVRPGWSLATLFAGTPRFRGVEKYLDGSDMQDMLSFIGQGLGGSLDWEYLQAVREEWDGPLVLKGVLDVAEAERAVSLGYEGIMVSNHGGRQFDGAPAAIHVLPQIAAAVGERAKILFDSGARGGLDIARALALGADFVLLGRAFMYGVAALGRRGGDHVAEILTADLSNNMTQLGCRALAELRQRRVV
ncbi:MAG: alpha-hydroxy-acid oxidizing protein [Gemmatimonadetes bacterium]|nr:alpha-hydroxy-acid oxidizing protein [Gemmatimonadota bacterium]MBT7861076.1 alpha-hydroxy-acid oxidizing protein [Gemmatimonadota bacterium]